MVNSDKICPVCEKYCFEFPDDYDICDICGWENDGLQREKEDYWGGANSISLNEARIVYSLSQNEETKGKIFQIMEKYLQSQRQIHAQYMDMDHRTSEGEKCRKAFTQAHNDFVVDLYNLTQKHK